MQLKEVMKAVWKSMPGVKSLTINVEKPLNSGAKLTAVADMGDGGSRVVVPHAVDIARALNSYESGKPWNRMEIVMQSQKPIKITTSFDQGLYEETLIRIK